MRCPYCEEEISVYDVQCPHCLMPLYTPLPKLFRRLLTTYSDDEIAVRTGTGGRMVWSAAFNPNNDGSVAFGCTDGSVRFLNIYDKKLLHVVAAHSDVVVSLSYSPNGKLVASASYDRKVCLVDVSSGFVRRRISSHGGKLQSVSFAPNGELFATGGDDRTIKLWDAMNGSLVRELQGHDGTVAAVQFCPNDPQLLASGSRDRTIRLWNIMSGTSRVLVPTYSPSPHSPPEWRSLDVLERASDWVQSLAFSPSCRWLVSGSIQQVRLWDVSSGALVREFQRSEGWINVVVISPCERLVAACSNDSSIYVWNAQTGELHTKLHFHKGEVGALSLSPDGKWLVSAGVDGMVAVWQVSYSPVRVHLWCYYDVGSDRWLSA